MKKCITVSPVCKKCGKILYWIDYGSMGSSHSNIYKCYNCNRIVEISDCDLEIEVEIPETKEF